MRRLVGQIQPDPDGAGPLQFPAVRYTYDADGQLTKIERGSLASWQSQSVAPSAWTGFTVLETVENAFDDVGNYTRIALIGEGTVQTLTQMSYDANDRLQCKAIRMNPAAFASLPASACTLGPEGAHGKDRITRTVYDQVGRVTQTIRAYGTSLQQNYATYTYSPNGNRLTVRDANNNETRYAYDGFDRLEFTYFLDPANGAFCTPPGTPGGNPTCSGNQTYERYGYDANGNRTSVRRRNGQTISFTFDALNRMTFKDFLDNSGAQASDVHYRYDLLGRQRHARFNNASGPGIINDYDKAGRLVATESWNGTVSWVLSFLWDPNGNRIRLTYPDGNYIQYDYDGLNRMSVVRENGATSGAGVLATYSYDNLGRRTSITRGNGTTSVYEYDGASRLDHLSQDLSGTTNDLELDFSYNPASQIRSRTLSNNVYTWTSPVVNRTYVPNALNQYASVGGVTFAYDPNGNLTSDDSRTFSYDAENRLCSVTGSASLSIGYDPQGRLWQSTSGSVTTQYLYAGDQLVAEFNGNSTTPLRRYVHGAGVDAPLVWYEGSGLTDRRWLHADERGSIVAQSHGSGSSTVYTYGPYGEPTGWTGSRFRYTGQIALPEAQLYHYKARVYDPVLGRFLQTDPIGYDDDINLYAYVGNDPVNRVDPFGRDACPVGDKNCIEDRRTETPDQAPPGGHPVTEEQRKIDEVVVTARKEKQIGDQRIDFDLPYPQEQYGSIEGVTVTAVKGKQERRYTCTDGSSGASNVLNAADFAGADAAVHTHPNWADPSPGMDDGAIPGALGIPNYGISPVGAWAIERTPSGYRARLISGRWGASRANVQAAVRGYNTGAGRGSSGKTCTYQ